MKPDAIIDKLGGATAVAVFCGVPANTAANWKARRSIPARYHRTILDMARAKEVTLTADNLADAHAAERVG